MSSNKQSILKSFAWPAALAVAAIVIGVFNNAPLHAYYAGAAIWLIGVIALIVNYGKDLEESMWPYYVQTAGFLVAAIWACVG